MSELSTTLPTKPPTNSADVLPYAEQMKKQLKKGGGFADLDLSKLPQGEEIDATNPLKPEDAIRQSLKEDASAVLRRNEGLPSTEPKAEHKSDVLDELENLSKPEKVEKKPKEDNMKSLRESREAAVTEAKTLKETLATKELEWQKRFEELETTLEKTAFERSPKFQQQFGGPAAEARTNIETFLKEMEADPGLGAKALALTGKERLAFIDAELGGGAGAAEFLRLVNEADRSQKRLGEALEKHKETKAVLEVRERDQERATSESMEANFNEMADRLGQKLSFFRKNGDETQNKIVEGRLAAARAIVTGSAPEEDMLVAPFLSVIARDTLKENASLRAELAKYKARLKDESRSEPQISNGETEETRHVGKPEGGIAAINRQISNRRG